MSAAKSFDAVVVAGTKPAICRDCGQRIELFRLSVKVPGPDVLVWAIPVHRFNDAPCPSSSYGEVPS